MWRSHHTGVQTHLSGPAVACAVGG